MTPEMMADAWKHHVDRFYSLLDRLAARIGGPRELVTCDGRWQWPTRGVYFFFEPGERRGPPNRDRPRVVRVGTHAVSTGSSTTLWDRLKQHRGNGAQGIIGAGNHRGSIFRRHVGAALLRSGLYRAAPVASWGVGSSAPHDVVAREEALERLVSERIGRMPFLWLEIGDAPSADSLRAYVERNSIALLARAVEADPPSEAWLGRNAADETIRSSGLWNVRHVAEPYDPEFLPVLERAVEAHGTGAPPLPAVAVVAPHAPANEDARVDRSAGIPARPVLALVSCTKTKASRTCAAAELYQPSTFFRLAYGYARRVADDVAILSAKYWLLRPADVASPYEQTLVGASRAELRAWAARVHAQLRAAPEYQRATTILWLAGESYRSELLPLVRGDGKACVVPMEGLAQGEQLAWLTARASLGAYDGDAPRAPQRKLEPAVAASPSGTQRRTPTNTASGGAPRAPEFEAVLNELTAKAKAQGKAWLEVTAGELHRIVGGYPGPNARMPVCCGVMRRVMRPGDTILAQPPKGQGASLRIRYTLA